MQKLGNEKDKKNIGDKYNICNKIPQEIKNLNYIKV